MIATTAQMDGSEVPQGIETVAAQVGALQTLLADPMLAALNFTPITVTQDKTTRALPLVARCEQSKLAVVRASWTKDFLDELAAFPESRHDDQVDSLSASTTMLASASRGIHCARDLVTYRSPFTRQPLPVRRLYF